MTDLFYPCIPDIHGRIVVVVSKRAMSREAAEAFLKNNYRSKWRMCEAIPKQVTSEGLVCKL